MLLRGQGPSDSTFGWRWSQARRRSRPVRRVLGGQQPDRAGPLELLGQQHLGVGGRRPQLGVLVAGVVPGRLGRLPSQADGGGEQHERRAPTRVTRMLRIPSPSVTGRGTIPDGESAGPWRWLSRTGHPPAGGSVLFGRTATLPTPDQALPGRPSSRLRRARASRRARHAPRRHRSRPAWPSSSSGWAASGAPSAGSGSCDGVWTTAVGYQGGVTPNPTYEETCTGLTGHTEAVRVVYDPAVISLRRPAQVFWETHDPTQGFRQGNDLGTQYRSTLYWTTEEQRVAAEESRDALPGGPHRGRARHDHHRDRRPPRPSTTPRTTTSSTWRRCRTATTATPTPGSPTPLLEPTMARPATKARPVRGW